MAKGGYQARRIQEKKQAERDARKRARSRRKAAQWIIAGIVGVLVILAILPRGGGHWGVAFFERAGFAGGSAKASATPSPSTSAPPSAKPIDGCTDPGVVAPKTTTFKSAPPITLDTSKTYLAHMKTTCGDITLTLDPLTALKSANNFAFLAGKGFYDKTIFHRVQNQPGDFAIVQGGDPQGTGQGGPGYQYGGEKPPAGTKYLRGVVAMANSGDPSSNGSQFFFVVHDWASLPANYTVFARVEDASSLAVLDKMITAQGEPLQGGLGTKPSPSIEILSVTIETK